MASGYEAGWDLYQKLKVLKADENVAPYVSEMHVVGLSLGGSDVSFMAYFDSVLRKDNKSKGIVDGAIVNWSSPANRYQAYSDLKKMSGISAMITDGIFRLAYNGAEKVYEQYTDKSFYWIFWGGSLEESLAEVQMKASNEYMASHNDFLKLLPFKKEGDFNRFEIKEYLKLLKLEYFLPHIKIPMLWIHSANDPIVSMDTVNSFISKNRSNIFDIYSKNYGGHIGQAHSYGGVWVVETMVRYFQYWGNFKASYYTQWKRPYEKDFLYRRYLRNDSI
jgi:predicted alpha/beta-fold hydrolase